MYLTNDSFYRVTDNFEKIENYAVYDDALSVAVVNQSDLPQFIKKYHPGTIFPSKDKNIRLTRALEFGRFTYCSLSIPLKKKYKLKHNAKISIIILENSLIFVTHNDYCKQILKKFYLHKMKQQYTLELILYLFFEKVIEDDLVFLEECERRLTTLESLTLKKDLEDFTRTLISIKSQLMYLNSFYSQLAGVLIKLKHNDKNYFNNINYFVQTNERIDILLNFAQMLSEYSIQIKDLYQSQIDKKQNNTMQLLTAITAIFLPLSLIVGWYGMNFKNMPELSWDFGYPLVTIVTVCVATFCIYIFKKKKWF